MHSACFIGLQVAKIHEWVVAEKLDGSHVGLARVELFDVESRACPRINPADGTMSWRLATALGDLIALGTRKDVAGDKYEYVLNPDVIDPWKFPFKEIVPSPPRMLRSSNITT